MTGDNQYIEAFAQNIQHYEALMTEAYEGVVSEGVSKYPVFIFHQQEVSMGLQIADRFSTAGSWSVNVSTLEEFYIKGVVLVEQLDEIKKKIAEVPQHFCCLVLSDEHAGLIFVKRQQETKEP